MKKKAEKKIVYGLVIILAVFWGLSFLATSVLVKKIDPIQIQAVRWIIASCVFLIFILAGKIKIDFHKKNVKFLFITGLVQPCAYMIFETYGIAMTSSSVGSIFVATIPSMALLISTIFLHKKTTTMGIVSIFLAFAGVVVCTVFSPAFSLNGEVLGYLVLIGTVIIGGIYTCVSAKAGEEYAALEITTVMSFMGAIFYNILNFVMGYGFETYTVYFNDLHLIVGILFLGVCCSAITYLGFNKIITLMDPVIANNLSSSMITVVGVSAGIFIAGDPGGIYTLIGLAMTLSGVYLSSKQI